MNAVLVEDIRQKIDEVKKQLIKCHESFLNGKIDFHSHQQKEEELLCKLEKLFIIKNTQGITY